MDIRGAVINAYAAARERGASRCEAFVLAVERYRHYRPELPVNCAGPEVARILHAAARAAVDYDSPSKSLASDDRIGYAEPA